MGEPAVIHVPMTSDVARRFAEVWVPTGMDREVGESMTSSDMDAVIAARDATALTLQQGILFHPERADG